MPDERAGRRLLAALAGSTEAFIAPPRGEAHTWKRRLLSALAGSSSAFSFHDNVDQHTATAAPTVTANAPEPAVTVDAPTSTARIRVLVVEQRKIIREAIAAVLDDQDDMAVVGELATAADVLSQISADSPGVAVLGQVEGADSVELSRALRERVPDLPFLIILSQHDNPPSSDVLESAAFGALLPTTAVADLLRAVRVVAAGGIALDPDILYAMLHDVGRRRALTVHGLTPREREVLSLIAQGTSESEIGTRLSIEFSSVRRHARTIAAKLGPPYRTAYSELFVPANNSGPALY